MRGCLTERGAVLTRAQDHVQRIGSGLLLLRMWLVHFLPSSGQEAGERSVDLDGAASGLEDGNPAWVIGIAAYNQWNENIGFLVQSFSSYG